MNNEKNLLAGDRIELEVTGVAHGGLMVARHEGRVIFVADAIVGEMVLAEITDAKKKSFARAAAVEVISESQNRQDHVWAEASIERSLEDRVGGAEFGHIALPFQRELKKRVLDDSMKRFGGVDTNAEVEGVTGDDASAGLGWRSRVRLHVDQESGLVGPYAARSRRVIEVQSLPLAGEQINLIAPLNEYMPDVQAIDIVAPSNDDARSLFTYPGSRERAGEKDTVFELVDEREFGVAAGGFWQVHREAPSTLFKATKDLINELKNDFDPSAANLDLYGGVGLFAAAMLEAGGQSTRVTSVEADALATDHASENLADFVGALALTENVHKYLENQIKNFNNTGFARAAAATVLLDPPRSGAGGKVSDALVRYNPKNIIYVACDPVALARDTKTLTDAGYALTTLRAFDLFPNTHHFESLALFQRQ